MYIKYSPLQEELLIGAFVIIEFGLQFQIWDFFEQFKSSTFGLSGFFRKSSKFSSLFRSAFVLYDASGSVGYCGCPFFSVSDSSAFAPSPTPTESVNASLLLLLLLSTVINRKLPLIFCWMSCVSNSINKIKYTPITSAMTKTIY